MKKLIYIILILLYPLFVFSQNVGIGVVLPLEQLHVGDLIGPAGNTYIMVGSAGGNTSVSGIKLRHFNNDFGFTIESNDQVGFQGLNIRRHTGSSMGISDLFIDISGNIGIGTTSPAQKLDVDGNVKVAGIISGVSDPLSAQDAATKAYVDAIKASFNEDLLDAGLHGVVADIDGNKYKTIKLGTQVWMAENLKTTHYNDGTAIPKVEDYAIWDDQLIPAYCWYDNDSTLNATLHGALYNYYTVSDTNSLNVCPAGWSVPTDAEWTTLRTFVEDSGYGYEGSGIDIGKSLAARLLWMSDSIDGHLGNDLGSNNTTGFTGFPSGHRFYLGTFNNFTQYCYWWSSEEFNPTESNFTALWYAAPGLYGGDYEKFTGLSVRCLRD